MTTTYDELHPSDVTHVQSTVHEGRVLLTMYFIGNVKVTADVTTFGLPIARDLLANMIKNECE